MNWLRSIFILSFIFRVDRKIFFCSLKSTNKEIIYRYAYAMLERILLIQSRGKFLAYIQRFFRDLTSSSSRNGFVLRHLRCEGDWWIQHVGLSSPVCALKFSICHLWPLNFYLKIYLGSFYQTQIDGMWAVNRSLWPSSSLWLCCLFS